MWSTYSIIRTSFSLGECPNDVLVDTKCSSSTCVLPDCACSGSEPKVDLSERPQIVYLTFDEAMTQLFDQDYYTELFMADVNGDYKYANPNGCPIRATFFVTALSNDFHVVITKNDEKIFDNDFPPTFNFFNLDTQILEASSWNCCPFYHVSKYSFFIGNYVVISMNN